MFKYENPALFMGAEPPRGCATPGFDELESRLFLQLLDPGDCAELLRHGWSVERSPQVCTIRKAVQGFGSKVYVVTIRPSGAASIEAYGELFLYSMSCARTAPIRVEHVRLGEWLWPLLDATESLNVFSDGGLD
jgi:hypothetical protein